MWCCPVRSSDTLVVLKTLRFPVNILILRTKIKINNIVIMINFAALQTNTVFLNYLREHARLKVPMHRNFDNFFIG